MLVDKKLVGGKNIREARKKVALVGNRTLAEGIELLKSVSYTKFDSTLEVVMKLGVDPKHSDQMVRGVVALPAGTGKVSRVAVICKDEKIEEAKEAGADIAGSTEIIDDIKAGKINFDVCIATPNMMSAIGAVARILGPKGSMPNPKLGTVTTDIVTAIKNAKGGQVEYRVEKAGIIHTGVGKLSFSKQDLLDNASTLISAVVKAKPFGVKGNYLKAIYLSSTMSPSAALKKVLMDYFRNNGDNNFNANNRVEDNDLNFNNQNVGNFTTTEVASLNTSDATLPLAGEAEHPTE